MKHLICVILVVLFTSCSLSNRNEHPLDQQHTGNTPPESYIKWRVKRYDYNYEPWTYIDEQRCGWRYDGWMNQLDYKDADICVYVCETRPKTEFRNDLFPTLERCLYYDYQSE